LVAISIFLFFLQIKKKFFKAKLFVEYLLLITFILNILVIILSFVSNSREFFQGVNLLVRSYGHNHYVAFLLLVLPLIWWHLLEETPSYFLTNKVKVFFDIFLLISSYLLLLISLSRWALFISIIQFFLIFLLVKKVFFNLYKKKAVYFLIKSAILSFLSLALIFLFLSLPLSINDKENCFLRLYGKDLCTPIEQNSRFFYWRQAWLSFKNYPIVGYGLGSFKYAARRFPIINQQNSAYAHNIFLHNLAEMGVLGGGSFILFIIYIFYQSGLSVFKSKNPLAKFLYLAAISSSINAMLDFDWHFFIIFLLTLIFLAFILSDFSKINDNQKLRNSKLSFLFILAFFTFILVVADILTVSWQSKKPEYWLKFTPFLNFAANATLEESVINVSNYESLYNWYRYDTGFINRFLNLEELKDEREKQLYLDLAEIDPVSFMAKIHFKDRSLEEAEILLKELLRMIDSYQAFNDYYFISYQQRIDLAEQIYSLGQNAYLQSDWSRASYFYQSAHFFDPYIFFNERAIFLDEDNLDRLLLFFLNFQDFSPHESGDYYHYLFLYRQVITKLFKDNQLLEFKQLVGAMFDQEPESKDYLTNHLQELVISEEQTQALIHVEENYKSN